MKDWFYIDKTEFDITDEEENKMGINFRKLLTFYILQDGNYLALDTQDNTFATIDIKTHKATSFKQPIAMIEETFDILSDQFQLPQ